MLMDASIPRYCVGCDGTIIPNGAPPIVVKTLAPGTSAVTRMSTIQVFRSDKITGTGSGSGTSMTGIIGGDCPRRAQSPLRQERPRDPVAAEPEPDGRGFGPGIAGHGPTPMNLLCHKTDRSLTVAARMGTSRLRLARCAIGAATGVPPGGRERF